MQGMAGPEIETNWSPMRLKMECWRPEFKNWSPAGALLLDSSVFFTSKENRFRITHQSKVPDNRSGKTQF